MPSTSAYDKKSSVTSALVPIHVGVIMDGNGRWAIAQKKSRSAGHKQGLETARSIVKRASERGIQYLSLYVFSTENWKRTVDEVGFLMKLIEGYILAEMPFYVEHNIKVRFSGNLDGLPKSVQDKLKKARELTSTHSGMTVNLAINYGGRDEILRAIKKWKDSPESDRRELDEAGLRDYFDNPDIPDLDLVIRTAGEYRTSNFFIWQSAYAELSIESKYWPDWTADDFDRVLADYGKRTRKYGGV